MLSMSSDTLESSGSRELAPIDYGQSRSSTPDSSASSRLAAQLERSAYRRSRSNIRQRQNSSNINYLDVGTKKSSRNKRLKTKERVNNRSYAQGEDEIFYTTSNGSFVVDASQKSSTRRTLPPDEDQTSLASGNKSGMMSKSRGEQHLKEYQFNESEDGSRILTARPVGAYTVSCVTVAEDNQNSLNYIAEDLTRRIDTVDVPSRRCQARGELHNGVCPEYRTNGLPPSKHNGRKGNDCHSVPRRNDNVGVSRVRFEESWEDTTTRKVEYKGRENSSIANNSRTDKGLNLSKYRTNTDNSNIELKDKMNNSITHSVKHRQSEEKPRKVLVNTTLAVEDETGNRTDLKEDVTYRKNNATVKREACSKPDHAVAQVASEISRDDEPKSLGLRQLIKIHEVQIAEVAKSAASMKRPSSGKFQEGRLVKVKVVPEIETKQTHMKLHAAKVSSPRNKTIFEENDSVMSSRNMPASRRIDVNDNIPDKISGGNGVHSNNDETFGHSRTVVRPKRHTVELRRTKSPMQEEQKWKRHTAIGLVGFDHQETRAPYNVNDWSLTGDRSNQVLTNDNNLEVEYLRKQRVEPEKQVVDEKVNKSDVIDVKTSKLNEISKALMSSDGYNETLETDEQNDVPPERPPLPKDFYCSTEDILERPPPPVADDTDMLPQVIQEVTLNNEIMKPITTIKQQCDIPMFTSLPNFDVSSAVIQSKQEDVVQSANVEEDEDTVLGNPRTTREMYEERLAMINLVPLDIPDSRLTSNQEMVSSHYTSLESFSWQNNFHLDKNAYLEKLKTSLKQVKQLKKEKEDLEKNFELKLRDWKRKYEEQQKVANAYQKLEDRYRRRVEDLQAALMQCRCSDTEARKTLLGQSGKRSESYFLNIQTQSILDETENWLKEQSVHSEITHNLENLSNNARIPSGDSPHGSLSDITGGNEWVINYKDFDLTTNIDQYNGTSV